MNTPSAYKTVSEQQTERTPMKINSVGSNQTEVERENGVTILFSYKTPVAAFVPGKGALCTSTKYSVTTSRHINKAVERWGATKINVEQGIIDQYAEQL